MPLKLKNATAVQCVLAITACVLFVHFVDVDKDSATGSLNTAGAIIFLAGCVACVSYTWNHKQESMTKPEGGTYAVLVVLGFVLSDALCKFEKWQDN